MIGSHRLMGSSVAALTASLKKVAARLDQMIKGSQRNPGLALLDDLDDDEVQTKSGIEDSPVADPRLVEKELGRLRLSSHLQNRSIATAKRRSSSM